MGAIFEQAAVVKDKDLVHVFKTHQPVSDEQEAFSTRQGEKHIEDEPLGERVKVGGRFIQQEDGSIFQQGTRNRQPLAFSATETKPVFSDDGFISLRQPGNELVDLRLLGSDAEFGFGSSRPGQKQILTDGIVKKIGPLGDDAEQPTHIVLGIFMNVAPIEQNPTLRVLPKAQ